MDQEQLFDRLYSLNLQLAAKNDQKKRKPVFYPEWEKDPTDTNDDVYYGLRYKPEAKKTLRSTWMKSDFESHRSSSA
nr:C84L CDS [African swine fever virus]CAK8178836.1 pC84L [African swine fever virus]CAK8179552.1 pC84L [African swine fever virus]CAK8179746.1 pC84L [African swine fever virus]CAK8180061.1 pC84L [African swine fever virus]